MNRVNVIKFFTEGVVLAERISAYRDTRNVVTMLRVYESFREASFNDNPTLMEQWFMRNGAAIKQLHDQLKVEWEEVEAKENA